MVEYFIIIGAPRSGTNILRDMLIKLQGVETWPCDEINYIWRHGNVRFPSDEFTPEMATNEVSVYIKKQFQKLARSTNATTVVEKTCANSLRVGFVNKVIPEAKYVFIVRDGLDAVGSALDRWQASMDIPYIMKKARYVPTTDLPYYAVRYLLNHAYRLITREKRLASWGPVVNNFDDILAKHTLAEVCALQWKACVESAERDLAALPSESVIRVSYESFVKNPVTEFEKIAAFMGKETPEYVREILRKNVHSGSVGKGRKALGDKQINAILPLISDTLERYNYE